MARRLELRLPFEAPPKALRQNSRPHWASKAKAVAQVRQAAKVAAMWAEPFTGPVTIRLVWTVTDRRRRDSDGPDPMKKAVIDGLVDAGLIPDDKHTVVVRSWCEIEHGAERGVRVIVEAVS